MLDHVFCYFISGKKRVQTLINKEHKTHTSRQRISVNVSLSLCHHFFTFVLEMPLAVPICLLTDTNQVLIPVILYRSSFYDVKAHPLKQSHCRLLCVCFFSLSSCSWAILLWVYDLLSESVLKLFSDRRRHHHQHLIFILSLLPVYFKELFITSLLFFSSSLSLPHSRYLSFWLFIHLALTHSLN